MTQPCTYCDRPAVDGGYIQPPMCAQHHALAILISMLKSRGLATDYHSIREMAIYYPRAGLHPSHIKALLAPMQEHTGGNRDQQ